MRWAVPLLILSTAFVLAPSGLAGDGDAAVAAMFQARCASCHTVPDATLRGDRAWLDQIDRTA